MAKESDKKREEIEKLKKRIKELESSIESDNEEDKKKLVSKKYVKKYVRVLVILVVILLIVDIISLIAYYKPNFSDWIKSFNLNKTNDSSSSNNLSGKKCLDGTLNGSCSKEKPLFCYNGELLKNAIVCGCPEGYRLDFQSCEEI